MPSVTVLAPVALDAVLGELEALAARSAL